MEGVYWMGKEGYSQLNEYFDLRPLEVGEGLHPEGFSVRLFFFFFCLFRVAPPVYGSSQDRVRIRAIAASLCHSHSHTRSEARLPPTPQLAAMPDP